VNLIDKAGNRGLFVTRRIRRLRAFQSSPEATDQPINARYLKTGRAFILPTVYLFEAAQDLQSTVRGRLCASGIATQKLPPLSIVHPRRGLTKAKAIRLLARIP
jgi:hypothetical protein